MTNPVSPSLRVVRINSTDPDPAIDAEGIIKKHGEQSIARYVTTRDPELLVFREGVEPVWIDVLRLPAAFVATHIAHVPSTDARRMLAFRSAVRAVGSVSTVGPLETGPHKRIAADFGVEVAPESFVQAVADEYGAEVVQELGEVAITCARLKRGARGPFGLWPSLTASG